MSDVLAVLVVAPNEPIALCYQIGVSLPLKDVRAFDSMQLVIPVRDTHLLGMREHHPHSHPTVVLVSAEYPEGIAVSTVDQSLHHGG